jgi:hypothetical protein
MLKGTLLVGTTLALLSFDLPSGWFAAGSKPKSYEMGIDNGSGQDGSNAATIKSIDKKINGFGTLMQNSLPDKYLGKRVRMTGEMKSKDVTDWAGFWFRVDQAGLKTSLSFDNMHDGNKDRSIKGTTDWKKYEIVLDVPAKATNLAYGALLSGTGQIWFTKINFEIVDNTVKTTDIRNSEPTNLNFDN